MKTGRPTAGKERLMAVPRELQETLPGTGKLPQYPHVDCRYKILLHRVILIHNILYIVHKYLVVLYIYLVGEKNTPL